MSAGAHASRRAELVARLDRDRIAVAESFAAVRGRMKIAEAVVDAARRVNRHRVLVGTLAAFAVVAPLAARTWLRRAAWMLPLVIEGIRLARKTRETRREEPLPGDD
jgi:hypothetical protein